MLPEFSLTPMKTVLTGCSAALLLLANNLRAQIPEWRVRQSPVNEHLYSVTYGKGVYVAVGNHRTILTSPNGRTWTVRARNTNSPGWLCGLAYGNGVFVAVGNGYQRNWPLSSPSTWGPPGSAGFYLGTNLAPILVSHDGMRWRSVRRGESSFSTVAFGRGRFVAAGLSGLMTSRDGYSWFSPTNIYKDGQRLPPGSGYTYLPPAPTQLAFGNGFFVVRSWRGATMVSSNGLDWIYKVTPTGCESTLNLLTFAGGRFVLDTCAMYGQEGSLGKLSVSPDGVNWSPAGALSMYITALGPGHHRGVVVGGWDVDGRSWLKTSPDGLDWTRAATPITAVPYGSAYGLRGVIVVGANGLIMHSPLPQ